MTKHAFGPGGLISFLPSLVLLITSCLLRLLLFLLSILLSLSQSLRLTHPIHNSKSLQLIPIAPCLLNPELLRMFSQKRSLNCECLLGLHCPYLILLTHNPIAFVWDPSLRTLMPIPPTAQSISINLLGTAG